MSCRFVCLRTTEHFQSFCDLKKSFTNIHNSHIPYGSKISMGEFFFVFNNVDDCGRNRSCLTSTIKHFLTEATKLRHRKFSRKILWCSNDLKINSGCRKAATEVTIKRRITWSLIITLRTIKAARGKLTEPVLQRCNVLPSQTVWFAVAEFTTKWSLRNREQRHDEKLCLC